MTDTMEKWPLDGHGGRYPPLRRKRKSLHIYVHYETETIEIGPEISPIEDCKGEDISSIQVAYSPSAVSPLEAAAPSSINGSEAAVSLMFEVSETEHTTAIPATIATYYTGEIEILEYYLYDDLGPRIVIQSFDYDIICEIIPAALKLVRDRLDVKWKILGMELDRGRMRWKVEIRRGDNDARRESWLAGTLRENVRCWLMKAGIVFESLSKEGALPCDEYACYPFVLKVPRSIRLNERVE